MGHGGGHGGHARGARRRSRHSSGEARQDSGEGFASLQTLQIQHEEPMLSITDAAGRERVVYTDGRKTEAGALARRNDRHDRPYWKDGHIQILSTPETGPKTTEIFAITADGSQLTVTTKMEGGRHGDVTIRRVYDAVKPGAPKPAPAPPPGEPQGGGDDDESVSAGLRPLSDAGASGR